jgi:hypothetical protein
LIAVIAARALRVARGIPRTPTRSSCAAAAAASVVCVYCSAAHHQQQDADAAAAARAKRSPTLARTRAVALLLFVREGGARQAHVQQPLT